MNDFYLALSAIFPLFFPMAAGYLLKQIKLIDDHTVKGMNKAVFRFFLPLLLCYNVYHSDLSHVLDKKLLLVGISGVVASFLLFFLFVRMTEPDKSKQGVMVQGMFRSNFVLFGLPLTTHLYGPEEAGPTALMIAVIAPLFNILSVIALELSRGSTPNVKSILREIVTNPLILSSALGLLLLFTGITIPELIDTAIDSMTDTTTPLALFLLGASFRFSAAKSTARQLVTVIAAKLVILPSIMLLIGYFLDFHGAATAILLAIFASPTAVSSFVMAQEMEGDADLAGQIVVWTSVGALVSIFCFLLLLRQTGGI